jgi:hypothetical protein
MEQNPWKLRIGLAKEGEWSMSNSTALAGSLDQAAVFGELSQKWGWLVALGIIQLILGTVGLGMTFGLTLVTILMTSPQ